MMNKLKQLWKDRDNQWSYFKWLMHYAHPYIGKILLMMSISLSETLATLFMVHISKMIIDNHQPEKTGAEAGVVNDHF